MLGEPPLEMDGNVNLGLACKAKRGKQMVVLTWYVRVCVAELGGLIGGVG